MIEALHGSIKPHFNTIELVLSTTLTYCIRKGLLQSPIDAIGELAAVRWEVLEGGVFVGEERPNKPSISPLQ